MAAERDNNINMLFGLTEYPSSSDDENNATQANTAQAWFQQQSTQTQAPQDGDEVINVDDTAMPNVSTHEEQASAPAPTPTASPMAQRMEITQSNQRLFLSIIETPIRREPVGPSQLNPRQNPTPGQPPSEVRMRMPENRPPPMAQEVRFTMPERRAVLHQPVPELSQPQPRPSASADIQSIIAFKRLQRYRAYRQYRAAAMGYAVLPFAAMHDPRMPNRRNHLSASGTLPPHLGHMVPGSIQRSPRGQEQVHRAEHEGNPEQNDENENQQSEEESEDRRLSPTLRDAEAQENFDNVDTMEDTSRNNSPPEEEAGYGDESEQDNAEEEAPAQPQRSNSVPNASLEADLGNSSGTHETHSHSRIHKRRRDSDRQNAEAFNVKEFNEKLLRLLECPVCLEWMEPPMWQCRRGHLVCARCRARLASCPVCRTSFSSVRNRAMEGVAELLRYPCRHGCGREARLRRRAAHEASCPQRRYRCPATACATRGALSLSNLSQHVKRSHQAMLRVGRLHKFSVKVNAQQHDSWLVLTGFGLFHVRIDVDIHTWGFMLYVAYIGPKCWAKNFTYEVTVVGQHNGRKLVYTRATHSDLESSTLNVTRQDCFHLTLDQAVNFLRFRNRHCEPDRLLDFTVEISKQDVNISVDISANDSDESIVQGQRT